MTARMTSLWNRWISAKWNIRTGSSHYITMAAVLFVIYIPVEEEYNSSHADSDEESQCSADANCHEKESPRSGCEDPPAEDSPLLVENDSKNEVCSKKSAKSDDVSVNITEDETVTEVQKVSDSCNHVQDPADKKADVDSTSCGKSKEESLNLDTYCQITDEEMQHLESEYITLEQAVQTVLEDLDIEQDTWNRSDDDSYTQVTFVAAGADVDRVLKKLTNLGIGKTPETSVSLFPASFHSAGSSSLPSKSSDDNLDSVSEMKDAEKSEKSEFIKSIKSRLTVAQVVEGVRSNARLTFDYIALTILASIIAGLGLAENSSVILVASMLVSPLMGPIMGGTFGFSVGYVELRKLGVKNESIGLFLCLVCGLLLGFITGGVSVHGAGWGSSDQWPTQEMQARGMWRGLWVGVLIAIPSGAGVALSIVGGNAGSLVGVAISASLLPPAVNAGMLWAYSIVTAIHPPLTLTIDSGIPVPNTIINGSSMLNSTMNITTTTSTIITDESVPVLYPPYCPALKGNAYTFIYSCSMAHEAAILGTISLILTLLNIGCIFVMSILVLKIKEIAPHTAVSEANTFWKTDLKVARKTYKTIKMGEGQDMANMARKIAQEWKKTNEDEKNVHHLRDSWNEVVREVGMDESFNWARAQRPELGLQALVELEKKGDNVIKEMQPESPGTYYENHYATVHTNHISWHSLTGDSVRMAQVRKRHLSARSPVPSDPTPQTAPPRHDGEENPFTWKSTDSPRRSFKLRRHKGRRQPRGLSQSLEHSVNVPKPGIHVSRSGRFQVTTHSDLNSIPEATLNTTQKDSEPVKDKSPAPSVRFQLGQ